MPKPLSPYQPYLDWIGEQQPRMITLIERWAAINSGSHNLLGLEAMRKALRQEFQRLPGQIEEFDVLPQRTVDSHGLFTSKPLGKGLAVFKQAQGLPSVLLCGHMDTAYPVDHPFQECTRLDENTLQGPGVADMKGGLAVMLLAVEALERSPFASRLGWELLVVPDEEIGSTGSTPRLQMAAQRHQLGLVFEPGLPDGTFVSSRMGSAVYILVARGHPAHVGRDFAKGRNAIQMLLPVMQRLVLLTNPSQGILLNLGNISGGGPVNVVPDLAILRFGLRCSTTDQMATARDHILTIVKDSCAAGASLELLEVSNRPPKLFDAKAEKLFVEIKACAQLLDIPMSWQPTGGVCDGNTLAAAGLPTLDTLGPIGGNLHTPQEYVKLDSLVARAQLAALTLMRLAAGEFQNPIGETA